MAKIISTITDTVREIHVLFQALLLKLLRKGRPAMGPDGAPVVIDGKPLFRDIGPADLAVVVSYLRLVGVRASVNAPQEQLADLIERTRKRAIAPDGAGDQPQEGTENAPS